VGSTKSDVHSFINDMKLNSRFIGGHPLAGSEKSGFSASRANLFENAYYCITPTDSTTEESKANLISIVKDMGAIPLEITPEEHDRAVAAISHIPHVIAALLVNLTGKLDDSRNIMKTLAAGGFKDLTRIASSSPELWEGICFSNRDEIIEILKELEHGIKSFENDLKDGSKEAVRDFFKSARDLRNTFSERKSLIQKTFDISVDVDDRPGIIAVIASALAKENINIKNIGILNSRENEEGALEIQFENEESRNLGLKTLVKLGYNAKEKE
jgi:prephenate dehydrogenase